MNTKGIRYNAFPRTTIKKFETLYLKQYDIIIGYGSKMSFSIVNLLEGKIRGKVIL